MAALETRLDRETRLRARIDELRDARDNALTLLWEARADIALLEAQLGNKPKAESSALSDLRKSRDMWRERARNAERMVRSRKRRDP